MKFSNGISCNILQIMVKNCKSLSTNNFKNRKFDRPTFLLFDFAKTFVSVKWSKL